MPVLSVLDILIGISFLPLKNTGEYDIIKELFI